MHFPMLIISSIVFVFVTISTQSCKTPNGRESISSENSTRQTADIVSDEESIGIRVAKIRPDCQAKAMEWIKPTHEENLSEVWVLACVSPTDNPVGVIAVFASADNKRGVVYRAESAVPPSAPSATSCFSPKPTRTLDASEIGAFRNDMQVGEDFDHWIKTGMDGMSCEYMHGERLDVGDVLVTTRISIGVIPPDGSEATFEPYDKLMSHFENLMSKKP